MLKNLRSLKSFLFFCAVGLISLLSEQLGFGSFSIVLIWLSAVGAIVSVIWFPFEVVPYLVEKEREAEAAKEKTEEQS